MKKEYQRPSTLLVKMETEGDFLMDSVQSTQHEGFTNSNGSVEKRWGNFLN